MSHIVLIMSSSKHNFKIDTAMQITHDEPNCSGKSEYYGKYPLFLSVCKTRFSTGLHQTAAFIALQYSLCNTAIQQYSNTAPTIQQYSPCNTAILQYSYTEIQPLQYSYTAIQQYSPCCCNAPFKSDIQLWILEVVNPHLS